uniref:Uncharacterized protein n=1 Tax=Arundo donax TaxID=35708 RepID=A0A0A9FWD5_ARUDO
MGCSSSFSCCRGRFISKSKTTRPSPSEER